MPSKIVHFYHSSTDSTAVAAIGTTFDAAKKHTHDLYANAPGYLTRNKSFLNRFESLLITVSGIAGGATTLTMRVCADAGGDVPVIPDTTATISTGITTATAGSVAFKMDTPILQGGPSVGDGTFYIFFKVDVGSVAISSSVLTWSE
jgi:hypothetical protein